MNDAQQLFAKMMEEHGITVRAVFVPFSQSRNKEEERPSLNWKVTLEHQGHELMTVDYGAGSGHCESVDHDGKPIAFNDSRPAAVDAIECECEDGKARRLTHGTNLGHKIMVRRDGSKGETWFTMPDSADVLYSLLLDGQAIDSGGFEDWAGDMGYDGDSITAKRMYDACLETGLKLRNAFGEALLQELGEAAQDL